MSLGFTPIQTIFVFLDKKSEIDGSSQNDDVSNTPKNDPETDSAMPDDANEDSQDQEESK
jgi:hypothetical protein